jgi:hypothetical protein
MRPKFEVPEPFSHLLLLTAALFGLGMSPAQQPPIDARGTSLSKSTGNSVPIATSSNQARQVPLLLELTDTVTTEVKPGVAIHFRVSEDVIEAGLVVIAKGTPIEASAERVDTHPGPEKMPVVLLRFETVKTVTGEDLPIESSAGARSGLEKLTLEDADWPGIRGFFGRTIRYAGPGTLQMVALTLPLHLDHARFLAARPAPETPPDYAAVYFFPHVWCGAVAIGRNKKVLLRPGRYSCRVERFSPQETYLEFDAAEGGTYFIVADSDARETGNLSLRTIAEVIDEWNNSFSSRAKVADLTKVDLEVFRKLPPFVCVEPCSTHYSASPMVSAQLHALVPNSANAPLPGLPASTAAKTGGLSGSQTKPLVLELRDEVTSRRAKAGDEVHFYTVEDVTAGGLVIIAKGTEVKGKIERLDKRGGWMKDGGVIVSLGAAKTVTGEDLPVAGTVGQQGGKRYVKEGLGLGLNPEFGGPITLPFMPFVRGDDYVLRSNTRYKAEVGMPAELDRARLQAAQPSPQQQAYATVFVLFPVWCGAVSIGGLGKTLFRPGNYSCRVETFSPQESYVDFTLSDGGTYYLGVRPEDIRPSLATAVEAVDMWNLWIQTHPAGNTTDLTKVDAEAFGKLPPFLSVEPF